MTIREFDLPSKTFSRQQNDTRPCEHLKQIGPLQDTVTWYGINYTGTQMTQWDFQNKGKSRWTGTSSFVLGVPLRYLRPSVIYSVPCDWILQRAYSINIKAKNVELRKKKHK